MVNFLGFEKNNTKNIHCQEGEITNKTITSKGKTYGRIEKIAVRFG